MLLRLIDRAGRGGLARPIAATDPLIVRRAEPADTAGILDLLDDTAEWLGLEGVPDWLAWPDRRDAVPPAIAAGETWLLCTQAGDIAGTITLSTGDPGPGLWAESERRDSATYVSRLAVRPGLIGRGTGAWLLDWADLQADRNGSALLRVAAWPRVPRLHDCLRRRGFRPLWTVAAPPATSRTLFARRVQGAADLLRP